MEIRGNIVEISSLRGEMCMFSYCEHQKKYFVGLWSVSEMREPGKHSKKIPENPNQDHGFHRCHYSAS